MSSDFTSLVLQAAGGANTSVSEGYEASEKGVKVMIAGLILQVVSLFIFLAVFLDFTWRCRRGVTDQTPARLQVRQSLAFRVFGVGLVGATVTILVRSIFRVAELWQGFGGSIWNDEALFMVLDGAMVAVASTLLSALHPGRAFGEQWAAANWSLGRKRKARSSSDEDAVEGK